ncbi:hypothetical protein [Bacillus gobiensis]|uniref:hypothetical protein n=1 Tax=Bacillus gobiensis TaxID=1441095 RepID=UPI003D23692E
MKSRKLELLPAFHASLPDQKGKIAADARLLMKGESVMNIHRSTGLARNTIYSIKREIEQG